MFPSFSSAEFERRHAAVRAAMEKRGVELLVMYGAGSSAPIHYVTNWLTTIESYVIFPLTGEPVLFVQLSNHVHTAAEMAIIADVRFGGRRSGGMPSTLPAVINELTARLSRGGRCGLVGRIPWQHYNAIRSAAASSDFEDFSGAVNELLLIKSAEEVERIREAAGLSDQAIFALRDNLAPGLSEYEIVDIIEGSYLRDGGVNGIHYFLTTSMQHPDKAIPRQYPTSRRLQIGDVVVVEISTKLFGYSGQVLRTFTVGAEPTPLYSGLHRAAEDAFDQTLAVLRPGATVADVVRAADVIHDRELTIGDDFLHGANQLPPIVRTRATGSADGYDFVFQEGMCVVVQPNVVDPGRDAGVQFGEMVRIGANGPENLHSVVERLIVCQ